MSGAISVIVVVIAVLRSGLLYTSICLLQPSRRPAPAQGSGRAYGSAIVEDVFVLLLTGPPGAGKSSVLTALHDRLGEAGVSNAMIEVDELERCYPPLGTERAIAHVGMLCASYRDAGYELLFLTATVEDDDYGRALLAATGAEGHLLARLEADPDTLRTRIIEREPAGWAGLDELVEAVTTAGRFDADAQWSRRGSEHRRPRSRKCCRRSGSGSARTQSVASSRRCSER